MRRIPLLGLFLFSGPSAVSAPPFPLDFEGPMCSGPNCPIMHWQLYADGTVTELNTGTRGLYQYDGRTSTYTAQFYDFIGTRMMGLRQPGTACVNGDWITNVPNHYGTFQFCKI